MRKCLASLDFVLPGMLGDNDLLNDSGELLLTLGAIHNRQDLETTQLSVAGLNIGKINPIRGNLTR